MKRNENNLIWEAYTCQQTPTKLNEEDSPLSYDDFKKYFQEWQRKYYASTDPEEQNALNAEYQRMIMRLPGGVDMSKVSDLEVDDVDPRDYPDFSDAFISAGSYEYEPGKYRDLTDEELEWINNHHPDVAHELAFDQLH